MIRLCMIGCGAIARQHLKAMQMIENTHITVTSLVDPNETAARSLKELLHQDDHCKVCTLQPLIIYYILCSLLIDILYTRRC